ncbi:GNAT family N-acetyltransferase [Sporosarcina thermotolerans]|uniref:GNAT family N-acetyltransferase n=1 Tax=Sporosarcina thermotolerans TaxID=633404 RepID=UPI0024BD0DAF|nr:GNAT family N-acetyltransferase [Sporosarcina thermotolerans]WHT47839.1 GNAT family N-acetyltransferase [Sporosarcina thermotolerans]
MPQIHHYWGMPDKHVLHGILQLHNEVFDNADELLEKAVKRQKILFVAATKENRLIGYKIGYELSADRYYSWYGAVQEDYRGQGIGSMLMDFQHRIVKEAGYKEIETKTRNMWRNMLILNIKHGFDITETFYDNEGIIEYH